MRIIPFQSYVKFCCLAFLLSLTTLSAIAQKKKNKKDVSPTTAAPAEKKKRKPEYSLMKK